MTRDELYQSIPRLRDIYAFVQPVEFNDASTGLLSSRGYTVRFYHEEEHLWEETSLDTNFASITLTARIGQAFDEWMGITLCCPSSENTDELSLYAVVVIK